MRILYVVALVTLATVQPAHAWNYTITNQTSGKLIIKVDLVAAKDMDFILEPGQQLPVKTGWKFARSIEVRGLSEPVAMMKVIHPIKFPFWNYQFNISHRNYNYVDPQNVTTMLSANQYSSNVIIFPGSGELVVERR